MIRAIFFLTFWLPSIVLAGIEGSAHDFKKLGWSGDDVCILCHTQQNAESAQTAQKWDYSSKLKHFALDTPSVDKSGKGIPGGTSRLCLSCHDGALASDILGNVDHGGFEDNSSKSLSTDHPISVYYNSGGGILQNPNRKITIGKTGKKQKSGSINKLLLIEHSIQCSSCHDVHNNYSADKYLLKLKIKNNEICLTCHNAYHESNTELTQFHQISEANLQSLINNKKMSCLSCHDIHEYFSADKRREKLSTTLINESKNLCLRCHKRRGL